MRKIKLEKLVKTGYNVKEITNIVNRRPINGKNKSFDYGR